MRVRLELRLLGFLAAAMLALGCLAPGVERAPRLYSLDPVVPFPESPKTDLALGVGPVSLPERLDRPQILTRSSRYEVEIAELERWAEPLDKSFARVLAENLSRAIPTDRISMYPWSRKTPVDVQVAVVVTRFEAEPDGFVTLATRWRLIGSGGGELRAQQSDRYREAAGSSTEELVAAMSRTVGAFSRDVASALRSAAESSTP